MISLPHPPACVALIATLSIAAALLAPDGASAIQLRWGNGATNLAVSENTQAILVVQADSAEVTLPNSWRLQWTADSLGPQFSAFNPNTACMVDTAKVDSVAPPQTLADSTANQVTAYFCSSGGDNAGSAYFLVDLPAGGHGRMRVLVLDSADTTRVIASDEVTYNGGVDGDYQPIILNATSVHHMGALTVTVTGSGLSAAEGLSLAANDGSWTFPLAVTGRCDSMVIAEGTLAAPLPQCLVEATGSSGAIATATVNADSFPPLEPEGSSSYFAASLDTTGMLAKDFAFVDAGDTWHIFYTRAYQTGYNDYENQRLIGHAVSTDKNLSTWTVVTTTCDTCSVHARPGRIWDNLHVWAPFIVRKPGDITYFMFYTGVQFDTIISSPNLVTSQIQRLGVATSTDLVHWKQDASPLYWNRKVPWSYQDSTRDVSDIGGGAFYSDAWQFRDPFVMADPDSLGQYLLYFTTIDSCARVAGGSGCSSQFVIGVARTPAFDGRNLRSWKDVGPLLRTSQSHMAASRNESPAMFLRQGIYWLLYTANHNDGDQLAFSLNPHPASLDTSTWTAPDSLKAITCGEHNFPSTLNQWHAPEALWFNTQEYLMAFSDDLFQGGRIQFTQIKPTDSTCPTDSFQLVVPDMVAGARPSATHGAAPMTLSLAGTCPVRSAARLQLAVTRVMPVHVAVYDVFGRRVKTLLDGAVSAGSRSLLWDGRSEQGAPVSSGIYFVRATGPASRQMVRLPLIR